MTKEELAITNLAQQKAIGYLANDIGDRLSLGQEVPELLFNLKAAKELSKLFLSEYGKPNADTTLLQRVVYVVQGLLNNYVLEGVHIMDQTQVVPMQPKTVEIIIQGGDGGSTIPQPNPNLIYSLKLQPADFYGSWVYRDPGLMYIDYELDITGGATLVKDRDYVAFQAGGFQLINGISLGTNDIIFLRAFDGFVSMPTPGVGVTINTIN